MKKLIALLLTLTLVLSFAACGGKTNVSDNATGTDAQSGDASGDANPNTTAPTAQGAALGLQLNTGMREKLDQMEYAAYVDIFYNKNAAQYENQKYTKEGVFATLVDAFSGVTRYYVWGYADQTKCCDYQWEFVMPEGTEIPESGVAWVNAAGESGLNVPICDPEALAAAIREICDVPEQYQAFAEGAKQRFRNHFTFDSMIDKTIKIYKHEKII